MQAKLKDEQRGVVKPTGGVRDSRLKRKPNNTQGNRIFLYLNRIEYVCMYLFRHHKKMLKIQIKTMAAIYL